MSFMDIYNKVNPEQQQTNTVMPVVGTPTATEATTEATPEAKQEATPEAKQEATPETNPEATPEPKEE